MFRRILSYVTLPLLLFLGNSSGNSAPGTAQSPLQGFNPGPDAIAGNMSDLAIYGSAGTQRGLAIGITTCNAGSALVDFFAMPNTHHPAVAQNLYRMSGGSSNTDRFEQIGQSWVKHTYGAKQANSCSFGCQPGGDFTHLGVGCSDTYFSSQSAEQSDLGSRAWINPFTGLFPSTARDHTGHVHTSTSHMILTEANDINPAMNPGATYYAELLYITPDEYSWCQTHPGECNMYNNASYRQYSVSGTTNFTFSAVSATVRMTPPINAWTGATVIPIEPEPGIDGRAYLAYKVTGPVNGIYHYEYAIYNQNLDRGIQSFSVPMLLLPAANGDQIIGPRNIEFHAPPQHPGFPADGTQGDAGFSSAAWVPLVTGISLTWSTETFAQNQNANAIRWGTLYNFRFDTNGEPQAANATIGFFKTGAPITVAIQGPAPVGGPFPTPTATATATSTATPTPTPTLTPSPSPSPSPSPTATPTDITVQVGMGGLTFTPSVVTIQPGETVNWVWASSPHSVTSGTPGAPDGIFDSGIHSVPFSFSHTFTTAGSFPYYCRIHGSMMVGTVNVGAASPTPTPTPAAQSVNLSTRMRVQTGDNVGIGGFIVTGSSPKQVLVRGIGPSLTQSGVPGALADPVMELHGPETFSTITNDNWRDTQEAEILKTGLAPANNLESAILATLAPGSYTAIVQGNNNTSGAALVELFDLAPGADSKLGNISTRAFVSTGDNIVIAGFILGNNMGNDRIIVRGIGPSIVCPGGCPSALDDPTLELRDSSGTLIRANNNWQDDPEQAAEIMAAGLAPGNDLEAAVVETLPPGLYTALLAGGTSADTGLGLVEVYSLGAP